MLLEQQGGCVGLQRVIRERLELKNKLCASIITIHTSKVSASYTSPRVHAPHPTFLAELNKSQA
jgi:hypothetical protein